MKKFFVLSCLLMFSLVCYASSQWLQIAEKVYINENVAKFIQDTNFQNALIEAKILNKNYFSKNIWYAKGFYALDCMENVIKASNLKYYDLNENLIKEEKTYNRTPFKEYDKDIINYMCITRKNYLLNLEKELQQENYEERKIRALEDISDEIFWGNWLKN